MTIKTRLRDLLAAGDFERVTEIDADKRRALAILVALTYDRDPEIAWRAVEALGTAAARVAEDDPNYVREQLRRLYWLISEESGAICWHAPEAMAEIVRNRPRLFADYIPIVVFLILSMAKEDLDHFKTGTLWAIGRLGSFAADHFDEVRGAVTDALDDPDPQVRGTAVWCLGRLGQTAILAERSYLLSDEAPVSLYENLTIQQTSVSELVRRMLAEIRE
ncbi:MAG: HEAT repeat domain-containing protein [Gemmatimonadales bacterium]